MEKTINNKSEDKKEDEEFKYRLRLAGFILDGNLDIVRALTGIKGIGYQTSLALVKSLRIKADRKLGTLSDNEINKIENAVQNLDKYLPEWMLNRQRDPYSGKDKHLIGPDLEMSLREDISRLRRIKSYRGIRHALGLPVRGQRTRTSFRKGVTVGVTRKKK